jgi:hypothetical protein
MWPLAIVALLKSDMEIDYLPLGGSILLYSGTKADLIKE